MVVSARVWFVTAGREVFHQSPGKFSSDDGGGGPSAACLMDAERTGWVSVLRATTQSSGIGQWTKLVLRGFQTAPIILITVRLWAAEKESLWKLRRKVKLKSWLPELLTCEIAEKTVWACHSSKIVLVFSLVFFPECVYSGSVCTHAHTLSNNSIWYVLCKTISWICFLPASRRVSSLAGGNAPSRSEWLWKLKPTTVSITKNKF